MTADALNEPTPRQAMGAKAAWTFVDQAISSLTNAVLTILVARSVSEVDFGAFSTAFLVFSFTIGTCRATITDPLVIRFSAADRRDHRTASCRAAAAAVLLGVIVGIPTAAVGLIIGPGESLGQALLALAVVGPGLLVQDAWRFAFFSRGDARQAALNDGLWAVIQFGLIAALFQRGWANVVTLILSWGLAALLAAVVGAIQLPGVPALRGAIPWVAQNRSLSWRLGADYVVNQGAYNAANVAIAPIASLSAVGALSAARTLLGPLHLVFSGTTSFILPIMVRVAPTGRLPRFSVLTSAFMAAVTLVWSVFLLLMPASWGEWLLHENWRGASMVILPTAIGYLAVASVAGASMGLKARADAHRLLVTTLVQAPLLVILGVSGAWLGGAVGAAWGFAVAQVVGLVLMWARFAGCEREHAV